jgi:hypothetical protein
MSKKDGLKIAVLNYSGNVGKSTLARHLLQPRMANCPITFVESINAGGDETNVKGRDFPAVMVAVLASDSAIVDIGSSNIEQVFSKVGRMGDVLDAFDYFLIPTVGKPKQQSDTVKVIHDLVSLGVPEAKLKLVLNFADPEDDVQTTFSHVTTAAKAIGITSAVVHESEAYAYLAARSIEDCVAEGRDFRAEISAAQSKQEKVELAKAQVFSRMARTIQRELDEVFTKLFAQPA